MINISMQRPWKQALKIINCPIYKIVESGDELIIIWLWLIYKQRKKQRGCLRGFQGIMKIWKWSDKQKHNNRVYII